jgi:hypothetical protein
VGNPTFDAVWLAEDDCRLLLTRLLTLPSGSRNMANAECKIRDAFRGWVAALATNAHCHESATQMSACSKAVIFVKYHLIHCEGL